MASAKKQNAPCQKHQTRKLWPRRVAKGTNLTALTSAGFREAQRKTNRRMSDKNGGGMRAGWRGKCPRSLPCQFALTQRVKPVSAGFRWRNGTKRSASRRVKVVCSRAEQWSGAV